ncbi:MAG: hypothetical protein Q9169_004713 [Polycauliona sp. 2 TL-2023]
MGDNWLAFELLTTADDPAARYFTGRLANQDFGAEKSFMRAKHWMEECNQKHTKCSTRRTTILPTRILDLSRTGAEIKLFVTNGLKAEYACLSYCWGSGAQTLQLTVANLAVLTENISLTMLPRSIQDAIAVARHLGIRYLWVDALCIIQDSSEDKMQEIKQMEQIYNSATLTIAAANADSCALGFLSPQTHQAFILQDQPIKLPFLCPDWEVGSLTLVPYGIERRREPLYCRSWPFQEYLLSPRVLMYGSEQMLWICQKDSPSGIGATFKDGGPQHDVSMTELKYMRMFLNGSQKISRGFARRNLWIDLVIKYSAMHQTVPDDKVHAIRGIASRYSHLMNDKYIAGLWKSWILPGLMWKRCEPTELRRDRQYPSWSWLSIDTAVNMEKAVDDTYVSDNLVNIKFIDFKPDPVEGSVNLFGLLPNAILHLYGHLTKVTSPDWTAMRLFGSVAGHHKSKFLKPEPARVILDTVEVSNLTSRPVGLDGPVWCLPVVRVRIVDQQADAYVGWAVQGLLLEEAVINQSFRRIGWFISDIGEESLCVDGPQQHIWIQ